MNHPLAPPKVEQLLKTAGPRRYGVVTATDGLSIKISGLAGHASLDDTVLISTERRTANKRAGGGGREVRAKIVAMDGELVTAFAYGSLAGAALGSMAVLDRGGGYALPSEAWIGRIIDPFGAPMDDGVLKPGEISAPLERAAPNAAKRKMLGSRLSTGLCVTDTLLPICRGQRIGLFAGSGVGKSSLLGDIACGVECDVAVIAMIGERGREVRAFIEDTLSPEGREKSVVIASTADQSPLAKKRGAHLAMATAEYFRDQGKQVLLLFDSLTRYAEAHREIALSAGEAPSLHAFPPSTFRTIASLVERSGPGEEGQGDITSVFSVLVAGSDHDEPVADMIRGILDGHIVLERQIAERGRFPAIDVSRSVSRSLPKAASEEENVLLREARAILRAYEDSETIVRAGLYAHGADPQIDRALEIWPKLDQFIADKTEMGVEDSFQRLQAIVHGGKKQHSTSASANALSA
ncbi:FliI/YscN family ATPase [Hyphococcus luteus]|uniref:Flagellum-specific ATP synthase FliI n=1 Tax=Hyphococcus luteus TaxID=2058213 RepID=A0A2S7K8N9_9PROT|nr:FliI/YscN family ATPase [Marinicaulis flavus]PQA88866.1 flagellum-specific ATP synthase FliI [Marinicaulis flavus]